MTHLQNLVLVSPDQDYADNIGPAGVVCALNSKPNDACMENKIFQLSLESKQPVLYNNSSVKPFAFIVISMLRLASLPYRFKSHLKRRLFPSVNSKTGLR